MLTHILALNPEQRQKNIASHYANSLQRQVLETLKVLEPTEQANHGQMSYADQVAHAACCLAIEYEALTGYPIMAMLKDQAKAQVQEESEVLPLA